MSEFVTCKPSENAKRLIMAEFVEFAATISDKEIGWFFDGRNRDQWMDAFIEHLQKRYQQKDRHASND